MNLITVARRAFLSAIENDFLAGAIVFDVTITVLPAQVFVERTFHALNAVALEVRETDHVTQHQAVRINPGRVPLEINAAQIFGVKF